MQGNLTLNIGFRYEYDMPAKDLTESTSFLDETKINPVCNCPGTITFSKDTFAITQDHVSPHDDNKRGFGSPVWICLGPARRRGDPRRVWMAPSRDRLWKHVLVRPLARCNHH